MHGSDREFEVETTKGHEVTKGCLAGTGFLGIRTPPGLFRCSFQVSFHDLDFILGQSVQLVHKLVDLLVRRGNLPGSFGEVFIPHSSFQIPHWFDGGFLGCGLWGSSPCRKESLSLIFSFSVTMP